MGNNITFHPLHPAELKTFVFDIIEHPNLAQDRAPWLVECAEEQDYLINTIYKKFTQQFTAYNETANNDNLNFFVATIAGYLHPYFYCNHSHLSYLSNKIEKFNKQQTTLTQQLSILLKMTKEKNRSTIDLKNKTHNRCIKPTYIKPRFIKELLTIYKKTSYRFNKQNDEHWQSLLAALHYCEKFDLGLLEVSNIVIPSAGKNISFVPNLRAAFLNNLDNLKTARYVQVFPNSIDDLVQITQKHLSLIQQGVLDIKLPFEYITTAPKKVLDIVASHCNTSKALLAFSTTTPVDLLDKLSSDTTFSNGPHAEIEPNYLPMLVASNRSTSAETLNRLADFTYPTIRYCVAEHANTHPDTLRRLFNNAHADTHKNLRLYRSLFKNPNTPKDILIQLSKNMSLGNKYQKRRYSAFFKGEVI